MVGYEVGSQFGFNSDFGKQIARSFHFHSTLIDKQQQTTAGSNKQQLLRTVTAHDFKPQNISLMRAKLFGKQTPQYSFDWYTQPSSTDGKDYSNQKKKVICCIQTQTSTTRNNQNVLETIRTSSC